MNAYVWRYREWLGQNDSVAPHRGAYWITENDDLDVQLRVWPTDGQWMWDVVEALDSSGHSRRTRGPAPTKEDAQEHAVSYVHELAT